MVVQEQIQEQIREIIRRLYPNCRIDKTHSKLQLTGPEIRFRARELLYLFFEIEKSFQIRFSRDDLAGDTFNSVEGISEIIAKKLGAN